MSGLTPPPQVTPREPDPPPKPVRRRRINWFNVIGIAILLLVLAEIVFVLPRLVERRARLRQPEPAPATATAPIVEQDPFEQKAEQAHLRVQELRTALEERGVERWAREDWTRALAAIDEGDRALAANSPAGATGAYTLAIGTLEAIQARGVEVLTGLLSDGEAALEAGDSRAATRAFELAQTIAPETTLAAAGLERARVLDELVELLHLGAAAERSGDLESARLHYARAAELDPSSRPAHQSVARVTGSIDDASFSEAMSSGLAAFDRGDYEAAEQALAAADQLRPGSEPVRDALVRVRHARALDRITTHGERARQLEQEESWAAAKAEYATVLTVDANIRFALEGHRRAEYREGLSRRLDYHLAHGDRLSTDTVYAEAEGLLAESSEIASPGPRLGRQVRELAQLLSRFAVRIRVILESDEQTEVLVYKVGRLGRFDRHELELRPGTYTVLGSRPGYRDVRQQLVVGSDGSAPAPLSVRCTEKI